MDKYEYKLKTEEMLELMEDGEYRKAAAAADLIDWKRVRNVGMLMNVSDIYEKSKEYQKSYDVMNLAYRRAEGSRKVIYKLCSLAIKTRNIDEAIDYYDEFIQIAPKDPNRHILRYQILRAQRAPIEQQIEALEEFKKAEYIEKWAYELAKLYQEAGMTAECLEECDDLILWFSEGKYVYKAMELKMQYKPLSPSQQEKYDHRYEKMSSETEEMPDLEAYLSEKETASEALGDTKSIGLAEQSETGNEPEAEPEKIQETDPSEMPVSEVATAEPETMEEDQEEQPATVETSGQKTTLSRDSASIPIKRKNPTKPAKKKIGDTMRLDEALQQLLNPKPEVEAAAASGEEVEPDMTDLEEDIAAIEDVEDLEIVNQIAEEKKAEEVNRKRIVPTGMKELIPEPEEEEDTEEIVEESVLEPEASEEIVEEPITEEEEIVLEAETTEELVQPEEEMSFEEILEVEEAEPEEEELLDVEEAEPEEEEILEAEEAEPEEEEVLDVEEAESEEEEILEAEEAEPEEEEVLEAEEAEPEEEEVLDVEEAESEEEEILEAEEAEPEEEEVLQAEEAEPEEEEVLEAEEAEPEEEEVLEAEDAEPEDVEDLSEVEQLITETEVINDEDDSEGVTARENMDSKKKEEPILSPEIQRLIDEIEGVIPPEEPKPVQKSTSSKDEPHENMGELTDDLRLDEDEYEEYDWDDAEDVDESDDIDDLLDKYDESDDDLFGDDEGYEDLDAYGYEEDDEEIVKPRDLFTAEDKISDDDLLSLDSYEEVPNFEDEFRVNPEHSAELDDREIPDEDDGIDIMSATTPLSRKETAKLIATGKTSPLPLDEISDAMSMSDTGFIVHGRYDLETQSGIGTRAGLTDEQKKLFSYFVPVRGMSEQLVDVLEQDKNCTNRRGTSRTGNLLIIGNKGNGKTVLAVDVVKAIQKQRDIRQGKVAIVTGESLNKKRIGDIFRKLHGGALIIEKAGMMNEKTLAKLNKAMEQDTGELLIVLEEQRKPLDRLLSSNREFRRKFTSRLEVPIFINDELVTFGQTYAQENGYRIDEMGILALYSKIDSLQREDHAVTVAEVKEVMDDAIAHSQKASAKKLVKRVFGKNTDSSDRILLSERDFNI